MTSYNRDQDITFNVNQIEALSNLFGATDEECPGHVYGSALNPSSLHSGIDEKDKPKAQPGVQMEVKTNNRNALTGGAVILKKEQEDTKQKAKEKGKEIWNDEEINIQAEERPDDRAEPVYEIMHKQQVGTEDTFLGLSGKTPSTVDCDLIVVKI